MEVLLRKKEQPDSMSHVRGGSAHACPPPPPSGSQVTWRALGGVMQTLVLVRDLSGT